MKKRISLAIVVILIIGLIAGSTLFFLSADSVYPAQAAGNAAVSAAPLTGGLIVAVTAVIILAVVFVVLLFEYIGVFKNTPIDGFFSALAGVREEDGKSGNDVNRKEPAQAEDKSGGFVSEPDNAIGKRAKTADKRIIRGIEIEPDDEDGIAVVAVIFRKKGKKVYYFYPNRENWTAGEYAIHVDSSGNSQEVIVVKPVVKRSKDKLVLPLKPLFKY